MAAAKSIKETNEEMKKTVNFADAGSWNVPTDNLDLSYIIKSVIIGETALGMLPPSDTISFPTMNTITFAGNSVGTVGKSLDIPQLTPKLIVQASITIGGIQKRNRHMIL